MKVVFLGVGEAFDEILPNTCLWLQAETSEGRRSVMFDCGFTAPSLYWRRAVNQEDLDALWISHFHGDHFFGVPALLGRFWEMKREKPFSIVGQEGIDDLVGKAMDLAYPNLLKKSTYALRFVRAVPGEALETSGLQWSFAENRHGRRDLAVRVSDGRKAIFYSGDGEPTEETLTLARGCDLAVHEAFRLEGDTPGHGTVVRCIDFARAAGVPLLAVVHVQRDERRNCREEILRVLSEAADVGAFLPEPGCELEF